MNDYKFAGLIRCQKCGANYRGKMQRDRKVYICSTYNKDSSKCVRYVLREEEIILNVSKHIEIYKSRTVEDDHEKFIKSIEVNEKGFRIFYKDGTPESIVEQDRARY